MRKSLVTVLISAGLLAETAVVSSQFQIGTRRRILNREKRSTQLLSRGAQAIHTKGNAGSPARMLRHHRPPWRRQQPQTHDIPTVHRTDGPSTRIDDYAAARQL